jgi:predicted PilT family ATPase
MQTAILISNLLILTCIALGYIYLRYFIVRQVEAKNATIETLRAEVEHHRSRGAPSLVDEVKRLSEFAEQSQVAINIANEQLNRMRKRLAAEGESTKYNRLEGLFNGFSIGVDGTTLTLHEIAKGLRATGIANRESIASSLDTIADGIADGFHQAIEHSRKSIAMGG